MRFTIVLVIVWDYPPSFCRYAWRLPASLDGAIWDSGIRVVADVR